jgi:hypothetical protein
MRVERTNGESDRNEPEAGLEVHSHTEGRAGEREDEQRRGSIGTNRREERKHPHFAQFEIKAY